MAKTIRISDSQYKRIREKQKPEERDMDTLERMLGSENSGFDYERIGKIVRTELESVLAHLRG
ncbi:Uncharacterised protein [Candidatus Anstonella stagnisolia]|nr:Uncharacterised protein [Candidatus Anstonella stagnisolia]